MCSWQSAVETNLLFSCQSLSTDCKRLMNFSSVNHRMSIHVKIYIWQQDDGAYAMHFLTMQFNNEKYFLILYHDFLLKNELIFQGNIRWVSRVTKAKDSYIGRCWTENEKSIKVFNQTNIDTTWLMTLKTEITRRKIVSAGAYRLYLSNSTKCHNNICWVLCDSCSGYHSFLTYRSANVSSCKAKSKNGKHLPHILVKRYNTKSPFSIQLKVIMYSSVYI